MTHHGPVRHRPRIRLSSASFSTDLRRPVVLRLFTHPLPLVHWHLNIPYLHTYPHESNDQGSPLPLFLLVPARDQLLSPAATLSVNRDCYAAAPPAHRPLAAILGIVHFLIRCPCDAPEVSRGPQTSPLSPSGPGVGGRLGVAAYRPGKLCTALRLPMPLSNTLNWPATNLPSR